MKTNLKMRITYYVQLSKSGGKDTTKSLCKNFEKEQIDLGIHIEYHRYVHIQ